MIPAIALLLALAPTPAPVEAPAPIEEDISALDLEDMLGEVSTASRREESLSTAPATVSVVDRDDIRLSSARTIPDLLRAVPGVQVVRNAPGNYTVSLRGTGGLQGNNIVVMIDNMPLNSTVDGSVDWGNLPVGIDDLDRIEVVRGPVSPIYGPNAYTGVIHLITALPEEEGVDGAVRSGIGIDTGGSLANVSAGRVSGRHKWFVWGASMDVVRDGLFRDSPGLLGAAHHPANDKYSGRLRTAFEIAHNQKLSIDGGTTWGQHSGIDHLVLESAPQSSQLSYGSVSYQATELPSIADRVGVWGRVRHLDGNNDPALYSGFSYDGLRAFDAQAGADLRLDLPHDIWVGVGGLTGLEIVNAPFLHPDETGTLRGRHGFYADAGADIVDAVQISGAVRGDFAATITGMQLSWRAAVVYYRDRFSARIAGGRAFRAPSYVEVGGRFRNPADRLILLEGTPGLESPGVDSVEAGVVAAPGHGITIRPVVYFARLQHLMVADFEPQVRRTFRNDSDNRMLLGGELELEWQFIPQLAWRVNVGTVAFLTRNDDPSATVAVPENNSAVIAGSWLQGRFVDDRLGASVGGMYSTPRSYNTRAGVPPQLISARVPHLGRLEGAVDWRVTKNHPLSVWLKLSSTLPHESVESPFPGAGRLGTAAFVGVGYGE